MPKATDPQFTRRLLAYHEAGHALALMHTRHRPLVSVKLAPAAGLCTPGEPLVPPGRALVEADLLFSVAGRAGERALLGREPWWHIRATADTDSRKGWGHARALEPRSERAALALFWATYEKAHAILTRPDRFPALKAIAEELLRRDRGKGDARIGGGEAWGIAYRAIGRR